MKNSIHRKITQAPPNRPVVRKSAQRACIILCFIIGTVGCISQPSQPIRQQEHKLFVIHVKDYTASTDYLQATDTATARALYYQIASHGGGTLRLMGIYSASANQQYTSFTIDPLPDTTSSEANVFKKAKAVNQSKKTWAAFKEKAERDIERYLAIVNKKHDEQFTDLATLFPVIETACNQPNFSGYHKYVVIESDLINDPAPEQKGQKLQAVHLNNATTVLAVRPAISEDSLRKLFPDGGDVHCVTDLQDAISLIK